MIGPLRPALALALFACAASPRAHGLHLKAEEAGGGVIVVRAGYDPGGPVALADVTISPPGDGPPFQRGQTDVNGGFAFLPDAPGQWRITVNDGSGHRAELAVEYQPGAPPAAAAPAAKPVGPLWGLIPGVAILLGAAWLWRRRAPPDPRRHSG